MMDKTSKAILSDVKKTYDKISEEFSRTRKTAWPEFEIFKKHLKKEQTLVDIGCGNGRFFKSIPKNLKIKYVGIDNSKNLIKEAKKTIKAEFKTGDILKIPVKAKIADITACIAVLHHIPSAELRRKAVKELHRITKKNGKLLLTVWNLLEQKKYKDMPHIKSETRGLLIPWGTLKIPRYYYAFKTEEIEKLLKPFFKIIYKEKDKNLIYICEKK